MDAWYDEDAGPLVRLYALTGGRVAAPSHEFTVSTIVRAVDGAGDTGLTAEQAGIVRLARTPLAVSEIAAHLGLPLGPVRVLLGELRDAGLISTPSPAGTQPSMRMLEQLLGGLLAL